MVRKLGVIALIMLFCISTVNAQDDSDCDIDLSGAIALLEQATTESDQDNTEDALRTITSAQLLLKDIVYRCIVGDDGEDSGVNLSESVSVDDPDLGLSFTVNYPDGWFSTADGLISNDEDLLAASEAGDDIEIRDGQIVLTFLPIPTEALSFFLGIEEGGSLTDAVNNLAANIFTGENDSFDLSDPEEIEVNGNPAAITTGEATADGTTSQGTLMVIQTDDGYVAMIARHGGDGFRDEIEAMAGAIEVSMEAPEGEG